MFHMVTTLREHFLMFPRFGNALDISSEYCEERYEEALAAYRQASECSAWEIGYQDEVWWSKVSQPDLHSWGEQDEPLRLQELAVEKNDPDPKVLACYGMLSAESGRMHLRFVSGRPVSQVTTNFLEWLCEQTQAQSKNVMGARAFQDRKA